MGRPRSERRRAPIKMKLVAAVRAGFRDVDEHPPLIVFLPQGSVERTDILEQYPVQAPAQRKCLAAIYLDCSIACRLRQHVQRTFPGEDEWIRQVIGPFENDLRRAGFGVLENLDRHDAALLSTVGQFLEKDKVSALIFDGKRIGPETILGGYQVAQSFKPAAQLIAFVLEAIGNLPLVPPAQ